MNKTYQKNSSDLDKECSDREPGAEKLLFSHVWEDPEIESDVVKMCRPKVQNDDTPYKMLMVCSGGDTLIHLLCENQEEFESYNLWIDVIDSNRLQIAITVFKILTLNYLNFCNNHKIYKSIVYGKGNVDYEILIGALKHHYRDIEWVKWLGVWKEGDNMNLLKSGVCKLGEMEKTFQDLVRSKMNFDSNFDHQTLASKFGDASVSLSSSNNFVDRFKLIHEAYVKNHGDVYEQNRFYYRMIKGCDSDQVLNDMVHKFRIVDKSVLKRIRFIHEDMEKYVTTLDMPVYDVIQTSNITDWLMTRQNIASFIKSIHRICRLGGRVIWRSLNGEYDLIELIRQNSECARITHRSDSSYFYKTVIISTLGVCADQIIKTINLDNPETVAKILTSHAYFSKLQLKDVVNESNNQMQTFGIYDFLMTQIPFYHAVENWVKVLCAVDERLKAMHRNDLSQILNRNIDDEKGTHAGIPHTETFKAFLDGLSDKIGGSFYVIQPVPSRCVESFNQHLHNIVKHKHLGYVCGFLGAIEHQYISISGLIKKFADYHHITQPHYTEHEILDEQHSADLFEIASAVTDDPQEVLQGAMDGQRVFLNLYERMEYV